MTASKPQQPPVAGPVKPQAPVKIALNAEDRRNVDAFISKLKIESEKPGGWVPYKKG